jgi:hypothetical protein
MKKFWSKRVLSFSLLGVMGASVIGFFTYYIVKLNVSDVLIEEDDTFAEGEAITFDNFDKVYIIEHDNDGYYFNITNFKAMFLNKLLKNDPADEKFALRYQTDSTTRPTVIKIAYETDNANDLFWGYKLNF